MEKNRLHLALEEARARGPVLDLIDTRFHDNGVRLPAGLVGPLMKQYAESRLYRPDSRGDPEAREAVAAFYGRHGVSVESGDILITASTSESYHLLFTALSEPGDNVVLPRPGYPLFDHLASYSRLEARSYRLDPARDWAVDADSIRAQCDGRTRFVVLISPNNPTGAVASREEVDEVLGVCADRGVALIVDEVFSEFLYEEDHLPRPAASPGEVPVFTLNGVSKMFAAPDMKLAWIAVTGGVHERWSLVERLEIVNDVYLSCSGPAQFLLPHLFARASEFQRQMVARVDSGRRLLTARLAGVPGVRLVRPRGGIHAVLELTGIVPELDDEEVAVRLLEKEALYLHPGYYYDIDDRVCLVLSYLKEPSGLAEGLRRLGRFLPQVMRR
jgi:aspartate/methionine/tyrosine aminotransferase